MRKSFRILEGIVVMAMVAFSMQGCGKTIEQAGQSGILQTVSETKQGETTVLESAESENTETDETEIKTDEEADGAEETGAAGAGSGENLLASPAVTGALKVQGTQLTDADGNPVQLKGISTHGLAWFPAYVNEECFKQFRQEWQANVIRLAMYTAENGGYCTDGDKEALKELIKKGVEYATNQDLYVIIDWHSLSDGNPNTYLEDAKTFFDEMSKLYADNNNVLYEICNEPNGGTSWQEVKAYAEEVIPVIRANDEDGIILVGTPNWSQYVDQAAADPITGYTNIMYTLHFYAATHTDWLRDAMAAAVDAGLPVFVSEYGICDASGAGAIDENQAAKWVETMDSLKVSYVAWNLSNKNETSAILVSSCNKTSGFTESDLSESGKWLYKMLTQKDIVADDASNKTAEENNPDRTQSGTVEGTDISYTAELSNSWEADGKTFYQYAFTVSNDGESDCLSWQLDVPFTGDVKVQDGWNGIFHAEGSTLHISPVDYNSSIPAGGSISDIGVIVCGGQVGI